MHGGTFAGRSPRQVARPGTAGPARARWVSRSVDLAMPTTQIAAIAVGQAGFVAAAVASELRVPSPLLVALHVSLGVLGLAVLRWRVHPLVFTTAWHALLLVDFAVSATPNEPLVTVAFAVAALTVPLLVMIFRGRWPVVASVGVAAALSAGVRLAHPQWPAELTTALAATTLTMTVVGVAIMRALRGFAAEADHWQDERERDRRQMASARAAHAAATQSARVLHDTVINTLGAVARGGWRHELGPIRHRCAQDLQRVRRLVHGGAAAEAPVWLFGFDDAAGLHVQRSGLTGDELRRYEALLPSDVALAIQGCVQEAVTNAVKHSGADRIGIDVRRDGRDLVVGVADDGVGFDGSVVAGRGLADSVMSRAAEHGVRVRIDTAPGRGTRVTMRYDMAAPSATAGPAAPDPAATSVWGMRRTMCWTWCVVIVGSGFLTETVNRSGRLGLGHLMLAVVGGGSAVCWWACRDGRDLPASLSLLVAGITPAMCLLAVAAIDVGRDRPFLFQAPGTTVLFAVLMVTPRTRWPLTAALTASGVVLAAVVVWLGRHDPSAAATVAILGTPIAGLVVALYIFYRESAVIGLRLADASRQAADARLEHASVALGEMVRGRWNAAGLQQSLGPLRSIADGTADPNDSEVRRRCGEQERYLRQITALTADSARMSWWFALALAEAQDKGVRLRVQGGSVGLHDVRAAEAFGRVVLACLDVALPGSELAVSLFDHRGGPRLFVVGGDQLELDVLNVAPRLGPCRIELQRLGDQTLVEAVWAPADHVHRGPVATVPVDAMQPADRIRDIGEFNDERCA